jgi:hypothetical protein
MARQMCGLKGTNALPLLLRPVLLLLLVLVLRLAYLSLWHLVHNQPRCCLALRGWVRPRLPLQQQVDSWALPQQAAAASVALAAWLAAASVAWHTRTLGSLWKTLMPCE